MYIPPLLKKNNIEPICQVWYHLSTKINNRKARAEYEKVYVLFLTLLVVCICGCNNAGKDGVDLSEHEEITEGFYARADLKEEIPTIYVWVSSVADSSSQWLALLKEMQKNFEIDDYCIYFDTDEFRYVYLDSEFKKYDDSDAFLESLPPGWSEAAKTSYVLDDDQEYFVRIKKNIEEKIMVPIREKYVAD